VPKRRWGGLRAKIIAWSFVPTAIILAAVALFTFISYQRVTEELVLQRDQDVARLSAGQLATELTEYPDILSALARTADVYGGDPTIQRNALMNARNSLTVFDGGVVILDTFGTVVATEPEQLGVFGQDWAEQPCYSTALRSQTLSSSESIFSNVIDEGPQGSEVVCVAVPITGEQDEFQGVIVGMFRLGATTVSSFYGDIVRLRIGEAGSAYLVDGDGRVIYHSDTDLIGESFYTRPIVQQVLAGQAGATRTQSPEQQDIVASFAPVPGTPWGLVIEESWTSLISESQGYQRFLLLLLVLGVAVPILVVAVGVRRITRPIAELISAAREVAQGRFGQTITAQTSDEIEELARQFNIMSAQLQESYTNLEQKVADRTQELSTLNAIVATVSQSLDLDQVLNLALDKTLQATGIEAGGIYLLDEEAGTLNLAAQRGFSPQAVPEIDRLQVGEGFSGRVLESGEPLVVPDVSTDPRLTRIVVRKEGLRSLAVIPLNSRGKVLGTIFAITHNYREFTDQDVQLLTSIGHQIGVAVENARLYEDTRNRLAQVAALQETTTAVASTLELDELLTLITQQATTLLQADAGILNLVDWDENEDKVVAAAGLATFMIGRHGPLTDTLSGWVALHNQPTISNQVQDDSRADKHALGWFVEEAQRKVQSAAAAPLSIKGQVMGTLVIIDKQGGNVEFGQADLDLLVAFANQAATAIDNARLFESEQRRAEQFRVVTEMGHRITSILDVDELLQEIVRLLKETFGYSLITIGVIEGDEVIFKAGTKTGWPEPQFLPPSLKLGAQGITAWVAATGEPVLAPDVRQEPRYTFWSEAGETRSELTVPLKTKGGTIGVLNVESDQLNAFDESDMEVLQSLANQAAIAIENARLYEQAQQAAIVEERGRLARELHDSVTQSLYSLTLLAEAGQRLAKSGDVERAREYLNRLGEIGQQSLKEMRLLVYELRPLALREEGLVGALNQRLDAVERRAGVEAHLVIEGKLELPENVEEALYRIAQEALNNALKHAAPTSVEVSIRADGKHVELEVADDGQGFDLDAAGTGGGMGLISMRERAERLGGTLQVISATGEGTKVKVCLSCHDV
jgi:nitrate/nitrite-specific signal transduction histidine kinase